MHRIHNQRKGKHKYFSWRVIGMSLLFSGVALVTYIISGISLRMAVAVAALIPLCTFGHTYLHLDVAARRDLSRELKIGMTGGIVGTAAYDVTRFVLGRVRPSGYNPFELIKVFGVLLAGASARPGLIYVAGAAFHELNGVCFGIAYWLLFGQYGVIAAIVWGGFLEVCQITLYPGWLHIAFYREFVQVTSLSHLMYGAALGLTCGWRMQRFR